MGCGSLFGSAVAFVPYLYKNVFCKQEKDHNEQQESYLLHADKLVGLESTYQGC